MGENGLGGERVCSECCGSWSPPSSSSFPFSPDVWLELEEEEEEEDGEAVWLKSTVLGC